jgi:hypothetical protein
VGGWLFGGVTREPNQQNRRAASGRPERDTVWKQWGRTMVQTCVVATYHLAGARARAGRVWRGPGGLARRAEKEREASWALGWALGWWLLLGCCWADGCMAASCTTNRCRDRQPRPRPQPGSVGEGRGRGVDGPRAECRSRRCRRCRRAAQTPDAISGQDGIGGQREDGFRSRRRGG